MVFSSHLYLFYFLPLVLALYYAMPARTGRHLVLTLASYAFYGWANPWFTLLMLGSTTIDYLAALVMSHEGRLQLRSPAAALSVGGPRSRAQKP